MAGIVLPDLSQLTEDFITAIYKQSDTANILDSFLFKDAHITVNGKTVSREHFLKELQTEKILEQEADVKFLNIVKVDNPQAPGTGSVGTFFTVTIFEAIEVRDVAVSHKITASLNVDFELLSITPSKLPVLSNRRKVKALNLVILDTPVPIVPPGK